ncbi:DUF1992 domain-containing protein [Ornithinibacillus salinisoli]|uniref:DUF1992 domain-containing protein n=1 Tax=Ornithinibacillus salinisoli TaxID=1848459 RepID=A0ABW4VV43_9BACI
MLKTEWGKEEELTEIEEKFQYTDHMSEIIRNAEKNGHFDDLPGKGKPLNLGRDYGGNRYEAQLNKTLKDNHVLPRWVELANEIDKMKKEIESLEGKEHRKKVKEVNKKVKEYNYACPPSLQKNKVAE